MLNDAYVAKPIGADRQRSTRTLPEAFGAELTERRIRAQLTQQRLADLLGYDVSYIGQIERAEKSPTLEALMSIASALRTRLSDLLKAAEERSSAKHRTR